MQNVSDIIYIFSFLSGVITTVNPDAESILMSLMDSALGDVAGSKPTLVR